MRMFEYSREADDFIVSYENQMLELFESKVAVYKKYIERFGYSLKIGLIWKKTTDDSVSFRRLSFSNGYQCYVYCAIQCDGRDVRVQSCDGEVDYYSLSATWMITSVYRKLFKLNVQLFDSSDEIDGDLKRLFAYLEM